MIGTRSFLKCGGLKNIDRLPGWPVPRAVRYDRQRSKRVSRRLDGQARNDHSAYDVVNGRGLVPDGPSESRGIQNPVEIKVVNVANRAPLKRVAIRECRLVHAIALINMRHGHGEPNRPADSYKSVVWILRIRPPVSQLAATEVRARFTCPGASRWAIIHEFLAALNLVEVLARIVIDGKLRIFVFWVVPPGALHKDKWHYARDFRHTRRNRMRSRA